MKTSLEIQNLKCGGCVNTIIKKVSSIDNVTHLEVDVDNNSLSFHYKNATVLRNIKALLSKIGYPVVGEKNALSTKAKSFVSCAIGRIIN
jgi:copper chaperone CopZ